MDKLTNVYGEKNFTRVITIDLTRVNVNYFLNFVKTDCDGFALTYVISYHLNQVWNGICRYKWPSGQFTHSKMALVLFMCSLFLIFASQWDLMTSIAFFLFRLWNIFSPIKELCASWFILFPNCNSCSLLIWRFISLYWIWVSNACLASF